MPKSVHLRDRSPCLPERISPPSWVMRCALAFLASVLLARGAHGGNLDAFYLSGEAALQAGAIAADAEGGGAIWYNPAGLADLTGSRLDVGVNGYAIRFGGQADLEPAVPGTEITRLTRIDLNVVPTALGLTRRFGPVGVGIGAFVPSQSASVLRTHFVTPKDDAGSQIDFAFDSSSRLQNYHLGAAFGFRPSPRLALGGAFFVTYQTRVEGTNVSLLSLDGDTGTASSAHSAIDAVQLGAEFVAALRWDVAKTWRIGAVARLPTLRLGEVAQRVETWHASGDGAPTVVHNEYVQSLDIGTSIISPLRIHGALSHDFRGEVRAAVEGSLLLPFLDPRLSVALRPTYNLRVGARKRLGPRFALGGGVFTDLSPNAAPVDFQETQLNFFGTTVAVDLATSYGVYAKNDELYERPKVLRFGTTISLSYALGVGSIVQAQIGPGPNDRVVLDTVLEDVVAHELTLHIGTTVME